MFPEAYRDQLFIARHGPWNRTRKDEGGDVVVAKLDDQGNVVAVEPFMTGLLQDDEYLGGRSTSPAHSGISLCANSHLAGNSP